MIDLKFPEKQACTRRVSVCGQDRFEIAFLERSGPDELAQHAVSDARVLDEYAEALSSSFSALTGTHFALARRRRRLGGGAASEVEEPRSEDSWRGDHRQRGDGRCGVIFGPECPSAGIEPASRDFSASSHRGT